MTRLAIHHAPNAITLPQPRAGAIAIRTATLSGGGGADLDFIDGLQKKRTKMVGWMPTKQLETYISRGHVLIAEQEGNCVGYCISNDRYFKRDDCGIVYQLNVAPGRQRGLIGATLIKAVFERAAYGCRLYCCWCAQDLEANYFWESLGFVPLAFRTGSRRGVGKKEPRIHIFWQRRIREGDTETPYWFPSETSGGAVKENRLVLPIPPGTHWSDAKPAVLPGMENVNVLPPGAVDPTAKKSRAKSAPKVVKPPSRPTGGLWFATAPGLKEHGQDARATKPKREKFKNDPKMVEAARELRDRYIEEINAGRMLPPSACGKYEVSRQLPTPPDVAPRVVEMKMLEAA